MTSHFCKALSLSVSLLLAAAQQIILDDMDTATSGETANTFEGSYYPCLADAYGKQFHHDWAKNKGSARFTFNFDPPTDGCYKIEEFHPGNSELCNRYLPRNTHLRITYCSDSSAPFFINQADRGGQWNVLGELPFLKGTKGYLTLLNSPEEQCWSPPCFWMADAFRLTRIAAQCQGQDAAIQCPNQTVARLAPASQSSAVAPGTPNQTVAGVAPASQASALASGMISIRLQAVDPSGTVDLRAGLELHRVAIAEVIAAYLGCTSVQLAAVVSARRLVAPTSAGSAGQAFLIHFSAHGPQAAEPAAGVSSLQQALEVALVAEGMRVKVLSASIEWAQAPSIGVRESTTFPFALVLGASGALLIAIALAACAIRALMRKARSNSSKDVAPKAASLPEHTKPKVIEDSLDDESVDGTYSTCTPTQEIPHVVLV